MILVAFLAYLAGVCTIPGVLSLIWLYDARQARLRADEQREEG